ncbi:MAG: hypothetical protein KDG55_03050, partial [Rhodocyclaceae bacterium]|nr:hypothetical protein [Rhodocyclaceae bacterium]
MAAISSRAALALVAALLLAVRPAMADERQDCIDGEDAQAVPACERFLAANPTDFSALMALGDALVRLNRHGQASDAYSRALAIDPSNARAEQKLKLARSNMNEAEFLRRRDTDSGTGAGHASALDRIRCTRMSGDAALAACERALRAAPGDAELLAARARLGGVTQIAALRTSEEPAVTPPPTELAQRLAALKQLRDSDVITAQEYDSR